MTVLTETTEALIETRNGVATTVSAGGNVIVDASSTEDFFQLTVNAGAGDSTSGAGGLNVLVNDTTTRALVGRDPADDLSTTGTTAVVADGSVVVAANSKTEIGSYAGTLGLSLSGSAVGISIGILVDLDETTAAVGEGTTITARGNGATGVDVRNGIFDADGNQGTENVRGLAVTATSYDDVFLLAIAASGSLGRTNSGQGSGDSNTDVGIAGSVGVAVLKGETKATIGEGVAVNPDNTRAPTRTRVSCCSAPTRRT